LLLNSIKISKIPLNFLGVGQNLTDFTKIPIHESLKFFIISFEKKKKTLEYILMSGKNIWRNSNKNFNNRQLKNGSVFVTLQHDSVLASV
jgi:hypothetical protein